MVSVGKHQHEALAIAKGERSRWRGRLIIILIGRRHEFKTFLSPRGKRTRRAGHVKDSAEDGPATQKNLVAKIKKASSSHAPMLCGKVLCGKVACSKKFIFTWPARRRQRRSTLASPTARRSVVVRSDVSLCGQRRHQSCDGTAGTEKAIASVRSADSLHVAIGACCIMLHQCIIIIIIVLNRANGN